MFFFSAFPLLGVFVKDILTDIRFLLKVDVFFYYLYVYVLIYLPFYSVHRYFERKRVLLVAFITALEFTV